MKLLPKVGLDELIFGMTHDEVIEIMGEPNKKYHPEENEDELIMEWNAIRLRLTFFEDDGGRLGYISCQNPDIIYRESSIIGQRIANVKELLEKFIKEWEHDDFETFSTYFNEENWLTLHVEYGVVNTLEMGVPFKTEDEHQWPEK